MIEGMIIGAYATGCRYGYIYIRGEYPIGRKILEQAIAESYDKGFLGENILGTDFSFDLYVHSGAGAYICGEETALINSLEGRRGEPRIKPPFPVNAGYLWKPTVVNNVETLANVPLIIERGGEWYASIGSPDCPGPKLFPVSGKVKRPGVYELPMGTPLSEIIYEHAGGILNDRKLKLVFPGGASSSCLTAEEIDVSMDFPSLAKAGTMLGSGAIMVLDETDCVVKAALRLIEFFRHESCGKCTPCREGTDWLVRIMRRIENGQAGEEDLDVILSISETMENSFCGLGMAAHNPVASTVKKFRDEYLEHIRLGRCPFRSS
jgi:NADH-quinone oxidoreductase subunit F